MQKHLLDLAVTVWQSGKRSQVSWVSSAELNGQRLSFFSTTFYGYQVLDAHKLETLGSWREELHMWRLLLDSMG